MDHLGIPAIKFQLEEDIFANGTVCPDNTCFGNNLRTGVQNVTQCKVKSPAFVSRPHFHLADPYYAEQLQYGVHPDPELHESSFWLEPVPEFVGVYKAVFVLVPVLVEVLSF